MKTKKTHKLHLEWEENDRTFKATASVRVPDDASVMDALIDFAKANRAPPFSQCIVAKAIPIHPWWKFWR